MGAVKLYFLFFWVIFVLVSPAWGAQAALERQNIYQAPASAPDKSPKSERLLGSCGFLISLVVIGAAATTYLSPAIYHELNARISQHEHVGHGIYLDWENIEATLSADERAVVEGVAEDPRAVVELFTQKLAGEDPTEPEAWAWFPQKGLASEYFDPQNPHRGNCRHRASILAALLNHLGIEARLQQGEMPLVGKHLWVYVPSLDLAADPYAGTTSEATRYWQDFAPDSIHVPTPLERIVAGTFY